MVIYVDAGLGAAAIGFVCICWHKSRFEIAKVKVRERETLVRKEKWIKKVEKGKECFSVL